MTERGYRLTVDFSITGIVLILLVLIPSFAAADGMAFRYRPTSTLESLEVNEQRAIIGHKAGMQRMFISITLGKPGAAEDASQAAVWIFAVPGGSDRADVDVTDFVPELEGRDLRHAFERAMNKVLLDLAAFVGIKALLAFTGI